MAAKLDRKMVITVCVAAAAFAAGTTIVLTLALKNEQLRRSLEYVTRENMARRGGVPKTWTPSEQAQVRSMQGLFPAVPNELIWEIRKFENGYFKSYGVEGGIHSSVRCWVNLGDENRGWQRYKCYQIVNRILIEFSHDNKEWYDEGKGTAHVKLRRLAVNYRTKFVEYLAPIYVRGYGAPGAKEASAHWKRSVLQGWNRQLSKGGRR